MLPRMLTAMFHPIRSMLRNRPSASLWRLSGSGRDLVSATTNALFAVDPVPWARAQMAFSLAFHIILMPLGVALPLVIAGAISGAASLLRLVRGAQRGARLLSIGAVATLVLAWGVAQWDFMLPTSLTVAQAAAPDGTIKAVLFAVVLAALLVVPGFALLYILDQKGVLPEEGAKDLHDS